MINWPVLFLSLGIVESSNDVTKVNQKEQAYGIYQLRQPALDDFNSWEGTDFKLPDFIWHGEESIKAAKVVFFEYGRHYGAETAEEFCRIGNGGPKGMKKKSTVKYWNKVKMNYDQLCKGGG